MFDLAGLEAAEKGDVENDVARQILILKERMCNG
jgi:hypothetical protein